MQESHVTHVNLAVINICAQRSCRQGGYATDWCMVPTMAKRFLNFEKCEDSNQSESSRFYCFDDNELEEKIREQIFLNSERSAKFAINVWNAWASQRNDLQTNPNMPKVSI